MEVMIKRETALEARCIISFLINECRESASCAEQCGACAVNRSAKRVLRALADATKDSPVDHMEMLALEEVPLLQNGRLRAQVRRR